MSRISRSRKLSFALWSTVAGVGLAACGDDDPSGKLADAPRSIDAAVDVAPPVDVALAPIASLASSQLVGTVECGGTAPTASLSVMNTGNAPLILQTATADGGFTVGTTLPLTIAAGGSATLAVTAPAAVIGTDRGGTAKTGTLTVTTNEGSAATHSVALTANVVGANLEFTDAAATPISPLSFTGSSGSCPSRETVYLRNTGNAPLFVQPPSGTVSSGLGFAFDGSFSGATIDPAGSIMQTIRPVTGSSCAFSAPLTYQVSGTICTTANVTLEASFNISGSSSCFCS